MNFFFEIKEKYYYAQSTKGVPPKYKIFTSQSSDPQLYQSLPNLDVMTQAKSMNPSISNFFKISPYTLKCSRIPLLSNQTYMNFNHR